jgi:hypothetical protein
LGTGGSGVARPAGAPFAADASGILSGGLAVLLPADGIITGSAAVTVTAANAPPPASAVPAPPKFGILPAPSEPLRQEVVALDRLFASLSRADAGAAFAQPTRHAHIEADSWPFDPL